MTYDKILALVALIICYVISSGAIIFLAEYGFACLNPHHNRQRYQSLNRFGVIVVTLFFSIILLPYIPFYWFYKLMTVKRKDK